MTFDELTHAAEQGNAGAQAQLGRLLIQKHYSEYTLCWRVFLRPEAWKIYFLSI